MSALAKEPRGSCKTTLFMKLYISITRTGIRVGQTELVMYIQLRLYKAIQPNNDIYLTPAQRKPESESGNLYPLP